MKYTDDDLSAEANLRSKLSEQSERPEAKAQAEAKANLRSKLSEQSERPKSKAKAEAKTNWALQ